MKPCTQERFWAKVDKSGGCWLWTGAKQSGGYGHFWDGSHHVYAHRYSYEYMVGPIPEGLTIDHLCRVRHCVNPSHMEPITSGANVLRGTSNSAVNARKTHCPQGHPFDAENTYRWRNKRQCLMCRRAHSRARQYRRQLAAGWNPQSS